MNAFAHIVVILLCMVGAAFFAGIETGVISIHRMRLRHFVKEGLPGARTLQIFLDDSDRLLGTTLVGTNIFVVIISVVSASLAGEFFGGLGEVGVTVLMSIVILIFAEFLPKTWFQSRPLERCRRFAGLLRGSERLLRPVSASVVWLTRLMVGGAEREYPQSAPFVTREDLKILVREGEKDGVLSSRERSMIHRVFELSAKSARQIMIPRDQLTSVNMGTPLAEFFETARKTSFTRMPVFDPKTRTFVGVINVFHVLSKSQGVDDETVDAFVWPPLFIPEDMPADDILPRMRRSRQPMCLVKNGEDEVTGLITTEDVLDEIVGGL